MTRALRLLLAASLATASCGPLVAGSSPESVFARAKTCSSAGDWAGFYDCIAPAKREAAIGGLLYLGAFNRMADGRAEADYRKLMESHGLDPNPPAPDPSAAPGVQLAQWLAPAKDRGKLFADLMAYTKPIRKADDRFFDPLATLSNVKVSGDSATGTMTKSDGRRRTCRFTRVDGRWYLDD